ncbi:MAG: glutamate--tRNA ligase [Lentimicrobiaceae bacterium]|nr:glutamate--tRNA ligase [Lentimicrobiaceae bacterium]
MKDVSEIRVRFAPSPTGPLHIGGVRTALYNYLLARQKKGKFILRIEDTDQGRFVPGAEDYIIESLHWIGLRFDEGIRESGPYAPYRQSDRQAIYREYAEQLIVSGNAYYAFDTPEELEAMRKKLESERAVNTSYSYLSRMSMTNSLTLSQEEVAERIRAGQPYVIRFRIPADQEVRVYDLIRDWIVVHSSTMDDKVLFKSDGMPTYHLANVVDDHLMKITHVIRGEEWLPSLPLHALLYRAFGWEEPEFAHLPLLLKPDGKGKLSKRDGDRLGFPVFPLQWKDPFTGDISTGYRESGYFPEAFVNMLAFLGWNPGTEQEMFSMDELIEAFSIERVGKSGSRFDPEKAKWYNRQYLQRQPAEVLVQLFRPVLEAKGVRADETLIRKVVEMVRERVDFVRDIWDQSWFFFKAPESYDQEVVRKRWKQETPAMMTEAASLLKDLEPFTSPVLEARLKEWMEQKGYGTGQVMNALRLCLVGAGIGPHLTEIMETIGKEETIKRILRGVDALNGS